MLNYKRNLSLIILSLTTIFEIKQVKREREREEGGTTRRKLEKNTFKYN